MQPIRSTALRAVAYDPGRRVLTIVFRKGGAVYDCFGVPPVVFEGLLASQPHPWSRWGPVVLRYPKIRRR